MPTARTSSLAALLIGLVGCRGLALERERRHDWPAMREAQARFYLAAWDVPMDAVRLDAERGRFDCVWDAVARAGLDPHADVDCMMRRMDAMPGCLRAGPSDPGCAARVNASCAVSPAYERAAQACRRTGEPPASQGPAGDP